ncbi:hypothetical protein ACSTS3_18665 [Aquimarina muelleri]|uniref:hypothetical protein n=1 Tax=Aquimarina muelleri TaxID=279356 RepID=UPI003F686BF4
MVLIKDSPIPKTSTKNIITIVITAAIELNHTATDLILLLSPKEVINKPITSINIM